MEFCVDDQDVKKPLEMTDEETGEGVCMGVKTSDAIVIDAEAEFCVDDQETMIGVCSR